MNISQIWLKMPIPAAKIDVFGGFRPLNIIFHHRHPQKALPWPKPRILIFELLSVAIAPAARPGQVVKNTKKTKGRNIQSREKPGIGPAHALNPILTIFGMWGAPWIWF